MVEKEVTPEMRRTAWREFFRQEKRFLVACSLFPMMMLIFGSFTIKDLVYYASDDKTVPATIIFYIGGFVLIFILIPWSGFLFGVITKFAKVQGFKKPSILRWLGDVGMAYNCVRSPFVSKFWRRVYIIAAVLNFVALPSYLILFKIALQAD